MFSDERRELRACIEVTCHRFRALVYTHVDVTSVSVVMVTYHTDVPASFKLLCEEA